ncbi:MAG: PocR ligand-binding domain-containing protein [Verrucomicrobiota bacterium]
MPSLTAAKSASSEGLSTSPQPSLLEAFCDQIEQITGLRICIYDFGYFTMENDRLQLPYLRREHCSPYCLLVKSNPSAAACCIKTESWRSSKAAESKTAFVHRCHAGIVDMVVPIRLGARAVGAIFVGQCAPSDLKQQAMASERIASDYGLDGAALLKAIGNLPTKEASSLRRLDQIAFFVADYIRQALGSAVTESMANVHIVRDESGHIRMDRVPNYFLDQISVGAGVIRNALQQVRSQYWTDISQRKVATLVGVSESHFSRLFKRTTGMTFRRCLVESRLSAAAWLIKKTDLKIKEVADLLNYRDTSSLQRALMRHSGATPTELRRRQPMPWHMNQPTLMPKS